MQLVSRDVVPSTRETLLIGVRNAETCLVQVLIIRSRVTHPGRAVGAEFERDALARWRRLALYLLWVTGPRAADFFPNHSDEAVGCWLTQKWLILDSSQSYETKTKTWGNNIPLFFIASTAAGPPSTSWPRTYWPSLAASEFPDVLKNSLLCSMSVNTGRIIGLPQKAGLKNTPFLTNSFAFNIHGLLQCLRGPTTCDFHWALPVNKSVCLGWIERKNLGGLPALVSLAGRY